MPPADEMSPGEIGRRLDEIAKFMRDLPDNLDEKFLRRETFKEVRDSLERQIAAVGTQATDVGASTKRAWREIELTKDDLNEVKSATVTKKTVVIVLTLAIAAIAASAAWVSAIANAHGH